MMDHNPTLAFKNKEEIKSFQEFHLKKMIHYCYQHSPFYKKMFDEYQIHPIDILSLKDLEKIPATTKEDIQNKNEDFICVGRDKIIEYTSTSGTLGRPVTVALTENDLTRLAYNEYCSFVCAEGSTDDIYQLMLTLDRQFMAGMAYYSGIRKMGAGIIRVGPGSPALQWETINRLKPTVIVGVPSFMVKLIEYAKDNHIDLNASSVKKAVCIGENIRNTDFTYNAIGTKIISDWNIKLYSTYASTEMQTAFTECVSNNGGHAQPDLIVVEILNDENNQVAEGEFGEVTITTLGVEGMPLIRYKTGDICTYHEKSCGCGRNTIRLSPVVGRKSQMIKYKGTTLYPPAIINLLHELNDINDFIIEAFTNDLGTDEILLHINTHNTNTKEVNEKIKTVLQSKLRIIPEMNYVNTDTLYAMTINESNRKIKKFIDRRTTI